ncbi:MAG: ABC transporter ATP-binding protein [Deltaproteobacteria bacterium]|nr:ABC transporter ATP-binding protein [Deltaproteobacteria bacterium]
MTMETSLLEVDDLFTGYGRTEIIHGVSIKVRREEIVTIIGPNGSGKSTLLKAIMGYLRIYKGSINFNGRDIGGLRTVERTRMGIAYVPQLENVFPSLTVQETLEMGGYALAKREMQEGLDSMFGLFPVLRDRRNTRVATMSGGQRQMLAMARALMVKPTLILLDEPSAGLSPKVSEQVFEKIKEIAATGTSMIIVEQDAEQSLAISNRGYVLAMGETAFEGPAGTILTHEKIREAYLGGEGTM